MAKVAQLPVGCHGQGIEVSSSALPKWYLNKLRLPDLTLTAVDDNWAFLKRVYEDFPSWPAKKLTRNLQWSRSWIKHPLHSACLLHRPISSCGCMNLLLWFPERLNGIACGDAVHLKAGLIYASLFCNHEAWSNTMPTKSALFALLYECNLWQIFNSCNLPETSTPWRQAQIGNGSLTHPSGLIIIILSTYLILYTH